MIKINYNEENYFETSKKIIEYGNIYARIIDANITMMQNRYVIDLVLEGKGNEHFTGFKTKSGYITQGPVTFARLTRYNITKDNINLAAKRLLHIATLLGNKEAMINEGNEFKTFMDYFNKVKKYIIGNKYLYFCIGAFVRNVSDSKYPKYKSFIVKDEAPLLAISDTMDNLVIYDENKHLIKLDDDTTNNNTIIPNNIPDTTIENKVENTTINELPDNNELPFEVDSDDLPY